MAIKDWFKFRRKASNKDAGKPEKLSNKTRDVVGLHMYENDPLKGLSAATLSTILKEAKEEGEAQRQAAAIEYMQERDGKLGGHLDSRKASVLGCHWRLLPADAKDPYNPNEDPDVTDLQEHLKDRGLSGAITHLVDALDIGYSGMLTEWGPGGGTIEQFHPIHSTAWVFDAQGNPAIKDRDENVFPLAKFHPNQFIFHTNAAKGVSPVASGLGRKLAWLWYFKNTDMRHWARFNEKFGIPFLVQRISQADYDNKERKKQIIKDLRRLGADGVMVVTGENTLEVESSEGHDTTIHAKFVEYIDRCFAIRVLGQLGSSEGEAGRLGNNEAQERVKEDFKENDCVSLMATITNSLIVPIWQYRHGTERPAPSFYLDYTRTKDMKYLAEVFTTMDQRGWRASDAEVSSRMGIAFKTVEMSEEGKEATSKYDKKSKVKDREKDGGAGE